MSFTDFFDFTDLIDIIRASILLLALTAGAVYFVYKFFGLVRGTLPLLIVLVAIAGGVWAADAAQSLGARTDRPGQFADPLATGGSEHFGFACKSLGRRHGVRPVWRRGIRVCDV